MSRTAKTLLFLITSLLLLFNIYWFAPLLHSSSPKHHKYFEKADSPAPSYDYTDQVYDTLDVFNDQKPKHTWPNIDEKDVVVLTQNNFSHFMAKNRYVMVVFYAPWCYWSRKLAPDYAAAATMLKGEGSHAVLAKVDCDEEKDLARKYHIQGYPSLYFFVGGGYVDQYYGDRSRDALASWVKMKMIPVVYNVTTPEEAEDISNSRSIKVLGFLDNLEGPDSEELAAAAKLHTGVNFYQTTSPHVAKIFHIDPQIKRPALVILNEDAENYIVCSGQFTSMVLASFITMNKFSLVTTLTRRNAPLIFQNPIKQLWLFAPPHDSENVKSMFQEAAKDFKGKLFFVYVDTSFEDVGRWISYDFGVTGDAPRVIAYTGKDDGEKYALNGELTLSSIKSFGEDFLEDKLLSKSDPISETVLRLPLDSNVSDPTSLPHMV